MKAEILYHPNQEFAGQAEDFKKDYERQHPGQKIELLSLETVAGAETAKLYDIVRYPAILVIASDGSLQKMWQDQPWPLHDEIASYLSA